MKSVRWGAVALLTLTSAAGAVGQEPSQINSEAAACAAITDSLQRLTCFDQLFPAHPEELGGDNAAPAAAIVTPPAAGAWEITRETSPIDDSPKIVAVLRPDGPQPTFTMSPEMLALRCFENTTNVIISTSEFAFGTDDASVTVRVDSAPARVERWELATDGRSVGLWSGATAIPFLQSIKNAKRLAVRVELRQRSDMTFTLNGVADVVSEIAAACHWPPA